MQTRDVIQYLEHIQREAREKKEMEEISPSDLEKISGAKRDGALGFSWSKAIHK